MPDDMNPSALLPRRNPGLVQRLTQRIFAVDPQYGPQAETQETTQSGVMSQALSSIYDQYFQNLSERNAVYKDVDEMDMVSPEFSSALDIIADNATSSEDGSQVGPVIWCTDDVIKERLDTTLDRIGIAEHCYSWARSGMKKGDLFLEPVVNAKGDVISLKMLPADSMYRNEDEKGNLLVGEVRYSADGTTCLNSVGECAFEQRRLDTGAVIAAWYPWQIIHARWNWDGYQKYGTSFGRVARVEWKKLKASEEAMIIGRLVRAFMKLAFHIDTTGLSAPQRKQAIKEFQDNVVKRQTIDGKRENPFYVLTDFFLADGYYRVGSQVVENRTRVETIDPKNDGLTHIDDIRYFHRKFRACLRVPSRYQPFEEADSGGGSISVGDLEFVRFVRRVQSYLTWILRQVCDLQLLLDGMDPSKEDVESASDGNLDNVVNDIDYGFTWPALSTADEAAAADADFKRSQAYAIGLGTSSLNQTPYLSPQWIQKHGYGMSDQDMVEVQGQIDEIVAKRAADTADMMKTQASLDAKVAAAKAPPAPPTNASVVRDGAPPANQTAKQKQGSDTSKNPAGPQKKEDSIRQADMEEANKLLRDLIQSSVQPIFSDLEQEHLDTLRQIREVTNEVRGHASSSLGEATGVDAPDDPQ